MHEWPLVSVIIPMFNRENTIERAIKSVLEQSYQNIELIIIDDNSSDNSVDVAQRYVDDARVKLIALPNNLGANVARNVGISNAKGDYIAFQDSDDEWMCEKLQVQMQYMNDKNLNAVFSAFTSIRYDNYVKQFPDTNTNVEIGEKGIENVLRRKNVISTQTLIISKEIVETVGCFDEEMPRFQDYEYVVRIIQKYKIGYIEKPLVKVYRQNNSISANSDAYYRAVELLLKKHGDFFDIDEFIKSYVISNDNCIVNIENLCEAYSHGDKNRKNMFFNHFRPILLSRYKMIRQIEKQCYDNRIAHLKNGEFAIYGTGGIGRKAFYELKQKNILPKYFVVSERKKELFIEDIPIKEILDIQDKDMEIIIAVSLKFQKEIVLTLVEKGFKNFFVFLGNDNNICIK